MVNLAFTALQASAFWLVFIVGAPWLLRLLEAGTVIPSFAFPGQRAVGLVVLVVFGTLNLWSGATMAVVGRGTPFPAATARELVVRGPYRFVRNPMALGGLGAGAGVGIALGSTSTLAMCLAGALVWHAVARPMEERDLEERFGEPYRAYQRAVRCWWPRLAPYRKAAGPPVS